MKKQIVTLKIETITKDGKGSGSFTDPAGTIKEAEVPFCMPGDSVETEVQRKKKGVFPGPLLQVIEPSKDRIPAPCIHFGICGGCSFQEIPYEKQLAFKEARVQEQFQKTPRPIMGCAKPYGYRNKMEFSFSQDKKGNRYLGLFMARGKVFNVEGCLLVSPWVNEDLAKIRSWWEKTELHAYYPPKDIGSLRTVTIRESATSGMRLVMLTVSGNPSYALHQPELSAFSALFDEERYSVYMRIHQAIKGQPTQFYEMHLKGAEWIDEVLTMTLNTTSEVKFQISPTAFFQPNTKQAALLYTEALRLAELTSEDVVYDLYCGTGTLGLLAARFVKQVIGIELSKESSLDARENAKRNGITNIEIITGSVGEVLKNKEFPAPTVVLLDPPRSGLDPLSLSEVIALNSQKIVYISCNPDTQSRDVLLFKEAGYELTALQPVDQFPQTPHIENITVLNLQTFN